MNSEEKRLQTFKNWPLDYIDKYILAKTGMYYTKIRDKVKCNFCQVEIENWQEEDNPILEHMKWSLNCPILQQRRQNNSLDSIHLDNIPFDIDSLEKLSEATTTTNNNDDNDDVDEIDADDEPQEKEDDIGYDVCGSLEMLDLQNKLKTETNLNNNSDSDDDDGIHKNLYKYPEYWNEYSRYNSFNLGWPLNKPDARQMANAGFFYTGYKDCVNCFSCGGGLKDWLQHYNPWIQHAIYYNDCQFVKLMKGIDFVKLYQCSNNIDVDVTSPTPSTSTEENKRLCRICYINECNMIFIPCGHFISCLKCSQSLKICPICRSTFTDIKRVYLS